MCSYLNFEFIPTKIQGLIIIEPKVYEDHRGYFMETYNKEQFKLHGIDVEFVQDNQSKSKKGVLRGLHFQTLNEQGKLVRVISGEVFDVAVDLRKGSSTYGMWVGTYLSGKTNKQIYIPKGFAHGFLVTSEEVEFVYKCTDFFNPNAQSGIRWDDPDIGIVWPLEGISEILLSEKDKNQPFLKDSKIML
jgi:dTDP-4-dehydrorhamnose 3,5-epimerase